MTVTNDPFQLVGSDEEADRRARSRAANPAAQHRPERRRSYDKLNQSLASTNPRHRDFVVPEGWKQDLELTDPAARAHYRMWARLRQVLREEEGIRPEVMHPTRDLRGVVKLTLPELYQLVFEPDAIPSMIVNGAEVTAQPDPSKGRFGDAMSVQHAQEIEQAREALRGQRIFPSSIVPTQDFYGRAMLTFAQLAEILELEEHELTQ